MDSGNSAAPSRQLHLNHVTLHPSDRHQQHLMRPISPAQRLDDRHRGILSPLLTDRALTFPVLTSASPTLIMPRHLDQQQRLQSTSSCSQYC